MFRMISDYRRGHYGSLIRCSFDGRQKKAQAAGPSWSKACAVRAATEARRVSRLRRTGGRPSRLAAIAEFERDAAEDGSCSAADRLGVRLTGGNAIKQPGADGDPMINADPSWS